MRSPSAILLLSSFFFVAFAFSQSSELLVQGQTGKLYLEHTVAAKENWFSVGRLYNTTPKDLTTYNHLATTQPLTIGEKLEIPLTAGNFSQTGQKAAGETLVPVYYIIQEKEWMYRVSVNHNKVPVPSLEKWNNLSKDQIRAGMHLIVGYLKVKTALSALAAPEAAKAAPTVAGAKPAPPVAGAKVKETATDEQVAKVKGGDTDATPVAVTPVVRAKEAVPAVPAAEKPVAQSSAAQSDGASSHNGGSFKGEYGEAGKSASGQAGTFKSTSGWQDGKYYALMNNMPVGTIVRVDDPSTGKTIYAKVLGQLPDMKESAGLAIRISNAAAAELGEGEGKFTVEVKY